MDDRSESEGAKEQRRTERLLLDISIEVQGEGADGKPFLEKAFTVVINRDGARIGLTHPVQPNDRLTITNLQNATSSPFRVVSQAGKSLGEGPEWGVECLEPASNIWGIAFPAKEDAQAAQGQESVDALLECSKCARRELVRLTFDEYRTLSNLAILTRHCTQCGTATGWTFGFMEVQEEIPSSPVTAPHCEPVQGTPERRRAKRLTVKVPLRLRLRDGREEITRTENLSETGACFVSTLKMEEGESVQLTVGYAAGEGETELPAHVVWRQDVEGTEQAFYGVRVTGTH